MSDEKLYKIKLTKPAKIGGRWYKPSECVKVDKGIATDIISNKGGEFTDPDESFMPQKQTYVNPLNPGSKKTIDHATIVSNLCDIDGISTDIAESLLEAGYTSITDIYDAEVEDLIKVKGIGKKSAEKIIDSACDFVDEEN